MTPSPGPAAIRPLAGEAEARTCARLMASTEPWITLRRTERQSLVVVSDPTCETHVLVEGDTVLGFVVLTLHGAFRGYIRSICVRADRRGAGLGSRLLAWAEERIFRESPNVFMCVSTFNRDAARLYERRGYAVVGELTDFLVRGHGEILLRKTRGPWAEFQP